MSTEPRFVGEERAKGEAVQVLAVLEDEAAHAALEIVDAERGDLVGRHLAGPEELVGAAEVVCRDVRPRPVDDRAERLLGRDEDATVGSRHVHLLVDERVERPELLGEADQRA